MAASRPVSAAAFVEKPGGFRVPSVVVLAGGEPWLRAECVRVIAGPEGDAVVRIDAKADESAVGSALDEFRTPGLFGGRKVVLVENAEAAGGAGGRGKEKADPLVSLVRAAGSGAPPGATLVLSTAKPVKGRAAVAADDLAAAGALVVDCRALYDSPGAWEASAPPYEHELGRFLSRRMKALHGKRLGLPDAHALVGRVGTDLAALDGAMRTLALSVGARPEVTAEDVRSGVGETREDPVFRIVDAILDGRTEMALDAVAAAFERGLHDQKGSLVHRPEALFAVLTAALHSAYRRLLAGAEALARGESPEAVTKAVGLPPFLARGFLERCRRDPADLLSRHEAFLEAETGVKGGGVPPRLAFERLAIRLMAAPESVRGPR